MNIENICKETRPVLGECGLTSQEIEHFLRFTRVVLLNAYMHGSSKLLNGDILVVNVKRKHLHETKIRATLCFVPYQSSLSFDHNPGASFSALLNLFDDRVQLCELKLHQMPADPLAMFGPATWADRAKITESFVATDLGSSSFVAGDPSMCQQCGAEDPKPKSCGRCHRSYYCSVECQRSNWEVHKKVCRAPE